MKKITNRTIAQLCALVILTIGLSGCSAIYTSVAKADLTTRTKMSRTVFLDPTTSDNRSIFVQVRNTSDQDGFDLENQIKVKLSKQGYQVIDDPEQANYWLQANIRHVVKDDGQYGDEALDKGFNGALMGGYVGSAFGSGDGEIAAVIAGALIGLAVEAGTSDVYYTAVTDVLVSVRAKDGEIVKAKENSRVAMGANGSRRISVETQTDRKQYQTRIVTTANKVNLDYDEAAFSLRNGLINSIAGIF